MVRFLSVLSGFGLYLASIGAVYGKKFNGFYSDEKVEQVVAGVGLRAAGDVSGGRASRFSKLTSEQQRALGAPFKKAYEAQTFLR